MPKEKVVSFRVNEKSFAALTAKIETDTPVGIKSENQLARKIVDDALAGRLVYVNPADCKKDFGFLGM